MPWEAKDAKSKTKRATSPKKQRLWAEVANAAKAEGATDGEAIRKANGAVRDILKSKK